MSEIINNLKQPKLNHLQEELAKTYFSTKPAKENHYTQFQQKTDVKKTNKPLTGIILGLIGLFIAAIFVFHRIEIYIKIFPSLAGLTENKKDIDTTPFSKNGELNRELIKNIMFYENADTKSNWGNEFVVLANEIGSKKAALGINFNKPLDMTEGLLCFYAKGAAGGEKIRICLRDIKNNFCYSKIDELQNSWQQFIIKTEGAKEFIDTENITHVDFELNPEERADLNRSTIYFKDICITKGRE